MVGHQAVRPRFPCQAEIVPQAECQALRTSVSVGDGEGAAAFPLRLSGRRLPSAHTSAPSASLWEQRS